MAEKENIPTYKDGELKLKNIREQLKNYEGKPGFNPYIWARDNKLDELEQGLAKKDAKALTAILSLPATVVPKV